jgi:hypothetical protein
VTESVGVFVRFHCAASFGQMMPHTKLEEAGTMNVFLE